MVSKSLLTWSLQRKSPERSVCFLWVSMLFSRLCTMLERGQAVAGLVKPWVSYLERQHQASGQTPHPSANAPSYLDREPWLSHGKELRKTLVAWDTFQPLLPDRILIHGLVILFLCFCFERVNVSGCPGWPQAGYVMETDPKMNLWSSSVSAGLTGMHHHTPDFQASYLLASIHQLGSSSGLGIQD